MSTSQRISRRRILQIAAGSVTATCIPRTWADDSRTLTAEGVGDVRTPLFHRVDLGTAPGRMHEPTAGPDGNIWTSPLDGSLWQYDTSSGEGEVHDLQAITGISWQGLHLWPVAVGTKVYLCTPGLSELWVWDRERQSVLRHPFPHAEPSVYGGFAHPQSDAVYFYDTRHASVIKWDAQQEIGRSFPCPFELSGTLYMSFIETDRQEFWGSTYTGNDLVRFDLRTDEWTAHYRSPLPNATPTAGGRVFGETLFASDHLQGRLLPVHADTGEWGDPIPVPGFRDWFGYFSGGWLFRNQLYFCHSTWTGGDGSLDGEPHHFIGAWTVFDPVSRQFSRLDFPVRDGESVQDMMSDYCATFDDQLFILAVNRSSPGTVAVLQSKAPA